MLAPIGLQPIEQMVDFVYGQVDLGDPRREDRLRQVAMACVQSPGVSFGQRFGSWSETKGAYRLLENASIGRRDLLDPLEESGGAACVGRRTIYAVQDTTEMDYSRRQKIEGLGPLHTSEHPGQGILVHTTLAVDEEGTPVGYLGIQSWVRDPEEMGKRHQRHSKPIEEKESSKWINGVERAYELLEAASLKSSAPYVIHVLDREGDIFEVVETVYAHGHGVVVRACRNRKVTEEEAYLWETLQARPVGGCLTLDVPAKAGQPARTAHLEVRWSPVTLCPPERRKQGKVPVQVYAVWVYEPNPPAGVQPLEWMLLTSEPVASLEEALEIIRIYRYRWRVEELHLILKSGCGMEASQFRSREALEKMLALNLLAALRILTIRYLAETQPDCSADCVLNENEQEALRVYVRHRFGQTLSQPMTVAEVRCWIGRIGGHLGRTRDGSPGVRTLWRGWRNFQQIISMYLALQPL